MSLLQHAGYNIFNVCTELSRLMNSICVFVINTAVGFPLSASRDALYIMMDFSFADKSCKLVLTLLAVDCSV